ncbi:AAA family ATPase, partial [Oceanobacillus indicireducens]
MAEVIVYNEKINPVIQNMNQVIIGKEEVITLSLVALLAKGHVLLEDVPGVGKTMLVRTLAKSLDCDFKRIQFTPDLLPSDVTGISIYNPKEMEFEFRGGPILGNIILADEINRTSPKTQSALLEAMEEQSVSVDGRTITLNQPFFVMATQNPIEYEGTYPLPEAQLDRFILKLKMGYPAFAEEIDLLEKTSLKHPIETIQAVMSNAELTMIQAEVDDVYVDRSI